MVAILALITILTAGINCAKSPSLIDLARKYRENSTNELKKFKKMEFYTPNN
jgi:hypothetical protein